MFSDLGVSEPPPKRGLHVKSFTYSSYRKRSQAEQAFNDSCLSSILLWLHIVYPSRPPTAVRCFCALFVGAGRDGDLEGEGPPRQVCALVDRSPGGRVF